MTVDDDALARIGASIANALWGEMTTEQIEELVDYDPDDGETLWSCLRAWAVTTVVGNAAMPYRALLHDPPNNQMNSK